MDSAIILLAVSSSAVGCSMVKSSGPRDDDASGYGQRDLSRGKTVVVEEEEPVIILQDVFLCRP